MALPKRRKSKSKARMRWANEALTTPNLRPCPNCGTYVLPHRVCPECMHYKGKQIVASKAVVNEA